MPPKPTIDAATFRKRLADLCVRPRPGLPRKQRDRHILLRSILLLLEPGGVYSEEEINTAIRDWRRRVASDLQLDYVAIRRALVDHGYLARRPDGSAYLAGAARASAPFDFAPEIDRLRPDAIVNERRRRIAESRSAYFRRAPAE